MPRYVKRKTNRIVSSNIIIGAVVKEKAVNS